MGRTTAFAFSASSLAVASLLAGLGQGHAQEPSDRKPHAEEAPAAAAIEDASMVRIPPGAFWMGSRADAAEKPVHRVVVAAFEMDVTEVTAAAYQRCVEAGACEGPMAWKTCNVGQPGRENHPVNCIDWRQADAFCRWAGKRLPSEEEWEYAARGSDGRPYPWGKTRPDRQLCWRRWIGRHGTCEVGAHPAGASPFGLQDMAGNVAEWTSSGFSKNYSERRDGSLPVVRGGGWGDVDRAAVRATARGRRSPAEKTDTIGFRCAR